MKEYEIHTLMDAFDVGNSSIINYEEFIVATFHLNKMENVKAYSGINVSPTCRMDLHHDKL